jgi:ATP-dependent protease HslVU (ClpYQ) peptidase subunit
LKKGGFAKKESEVETGGVFLVGYAGRLFKIEGDYQVAETSDGYFACGCGESYALGALYATKKLKPRDRIRIALQAAESHSSGVRAPFHIESA